jgi:glycosyltransferase involved in cell wall biosynthesis
VVVGSFGGSYTGKVGAVLSAILPRLLAADAGRVGRVGLLIGRGSREFAARLPPPLAARVVSTGELDLEGLAVHVAACDAVVQPYPDGVNTRRGSTMASLALGVPVITNAGHNMEAFWREERAVAIADSPRAEALLAVAEEVLADEARRSELGRKGRLLYERRFALRHTTDALEAAARAGESLGERRLGSHPKPHAQDQQDQQPSRNTRHA